jgi:hypothetical protein
MDDEVTLRYAEEDVRMEAREAERRRLRERIVEAQTTEEHGDRIGKWQHWTQPK